MRFRVLTVLYHGYGLALAIAALTALLGAGALAALLTFWFGGAALCLMLPLVWQSSAEHALQQAEAHRRS